MASISAHKKHMFRCLELAKMGQGNVSPNPMVGSIIVYKNKIIGEGYHTEYGKAHAEVNAIASVVDQSLLKDSTIYINLEPCAHFGKTPPCAHLIIKKGLKKVVIGCVDPFSKVAGKGVDKLKNAGIEVIVNILEKECVHINRRFFKFHAHQRPYIILKWAQSLNGFMDIDRVGTKKEIHWITQPETKSLVHKWRAKEAGILVGRKTIEIDNPKLTCRMVIGKNPTRIVIDKESKISPADYKIGYDSVNTIILNNQKTVKNNHIKWLKVEPFTLNEMLYSLYKEGIQSILVEGGQATLNIFIKERIWDEARVLKGISSISSGKKAPILNHSPSYCYYFGLDLVTIFEQ